MTRPDAARRRFVAAFFLFLAWVAGLTVMAAISSRRPPRHLHSSPVAAPAEAPHPG